MTSDEDEPPTSPCASTFPLDLHDALRLKIRAWEAEAISSELWGGARVRLQQCADEIRELLREKALTEPSPPPDEIEMCDRETVP